MQSLGIHYSCRCSIVLVLLTQNTQSTPKYPHKRTFQRRKKTFLRSGQDCNCKTSVDISITTIVDYISILSCSWKYFWYISDVSHRITTSMILFNELFLNVEAWTLANKIGIFSDSVVSSTWKKYSKRSHNFDWYLCLLVPTCAYLCILVPTCLSPNCKSNVQGPCKPLLHNYALNPSNFGLSAPPILWIA